MSQKLAVVIHNLGSGGAERVAARLINAWAARGDSVILCTASTPDSDFFRVNHTVRRFVIGGAGLHRNYIESIIVNARRFVRIRNAIRDTGTKTVVSFLYSTNILVILATIGLGVRVVISERNDPVRQPIGWKWRILRRIIYRFADVITANSRHAVDAMIAYVPREKLAAVPNPVTLPARTASPGSECNQVLALGRLTPQKGHDLLLKAFARLVDRESRWRLRIVGEGPQKNALSELAKKLGVSNLVEMPGNVRDVFEYYRSAVIFVLPSYYEGLPNSLLEAMAHGIPPIVSDSLPGAVEFVEDEISGLFFRSGDVEHLSKVIGRLMSQPALRAKLGYSARRKMRELDIGNVLEAWDKVLAPIASSGAAAFPTALSSNESSVECEKRMGSQ